MTPEQPHDKANGERWFLFAILALGVVLRLQHIADPLADHHSWRQTQTAMITRNLYRAGMNLWSPRVDFFYKETDLLIYEFPLYNAIVALLYKIFGLHEIIGRLVSVSFSIGAAYFLYRLSRRFYDAAVSLFATLFFILSPINIFYGRTFMPEALMLFTGIGALLYFHIWIEGGGRQNFAIALIFSIVTFLTKFTMLHLLFPMLYISWAKYGSKVLARKDLYLFLALFLIPSTIWFLHAAGSENHMFWLLSDLDLIRSSEFYNVILKRLRTDVLTQVGFGLFLFGLFLGVRKTGEHVFEAWLAATVLFVLVMGTGNKVHNYYQLPIVPVASIYIGKALAYILRTKLFVELGFRRQLGVAAVVALLLAAGFESLRVVRPWYSEEIPGLYRFAEVVKRTISPGEKVLISSPSGNFAPWDPRLMYAFDHKGWNIPPIVRPYWAGMELFAEIQRLRRGGVTYLIIYPFEGLPSNVLDRLITTNQLLAVRNAGQTGAIFKLTSSKVEVKTQSLIQEGFERAETAKRDWENWEDGFSISERQWEGTRVLELQAKANGFRLLQHRRIEVSAGTLYLAKVKVHTGQLLGPGAGIYVSTYRTAEDFHQLSSGHAIVPQGVNWLEASLVFCPPDEAHFLLIGLGGRDLKGEARFDNFELFKIEAVKN